MSAAYVYNKLKEERTIFMDVIFTCTYLQLVLFYLYHTKGIYKIGKTENLYVVYIILLAESMKCYLFEHEKCKNLKSRTSFFSEAVKTCSVLSVSVLLFYLTAILFGAPLLSQWSETFMFSLILTSVSIFPLCLSVGADSTVSLLMSLNKSNQTNQTVDKYLFNFKLAVFGAWLGAVVIPLDWDRPWQVWPVPCCIGAMLGCILANLYAVFNNIKLTRLKPHKTSKMI